MKKLFVLFAGVLISACFCPVDAQAKKDAPYITRSFPASSIKAVEVGTSGGSITLRGDDGSNAVVEVYVSRNDLPEAKIKQILNENYIIDIKVEGGKLYAVAKLKNITPNKIRQVLGISFKMTVPKQINSELQTSGGSIHIADLQGSQNFKTSGGSLSIQNNSGNITGSTSGGSITISGSKDKIDLNTSGGSVTARDCKGQINLRTSGGSLTLNDLSGDIKASTSGGSVTANNINGTFKTSTSGGSMKLNEISGNLEASNAGGSINVKMKSASDYVKITNSGNISLTLPSGGGYSLKANTSASLDISGLRDFNGRQTSRSIDGKMGNGATEINLTSSQNLRLSFE
jgi:hypothetical protein